MCGEREKEREREREREREVGYIYHKVSNVYALFEGEFFTDGLRFIGTIVMSAFVRQRFLKRLANPIFSQLSKI